MNKKWNLQDIRPATPRKKRSRPVQVIPKEEAQAKLQMQADEPEASTEDESINPINQTETFDDAMRVQIDNGNNKKRSHLILAFVVFAVVVSGGFFVSFLTGGAEITVKPRHREPTINATFEAYRTPQVGDLSYEIMILEAEGERQVSASGQEEVQTQATGEITIFKRTTGTERLIKNTRFETSDGLVFRISESVVVPGAVENADGELIPGAINAAVFADDIGEEYNVSENTRFSIPGFKEGGYMELYDNIYAANESAFADGFDGTKFIIEEAELETSKQALQMELRDSLLARIPEEQPSGFIVFDDAVTVTYESLPAVEYGDNLATIKEKALLQIPIFDEDEFASYIAAASIPGYENEPIRIDNLHELAFAYSSATTSISDISALANVTFRMNGKPQLVWTYDEGRLKTDLLGAQKTAVPTILGAYPAVESAEAVVRPFWKSTFPTELDAIEITEIIER